MTPNIIGCISGQTLRTPRRPEIGRASSNGVGHLRRSPRQCRRHLPDRFASRAGSSSANRNVISTCSGIRAPAIRLLLDCGFRLKMRAARSIASCFAVAITTFLIATDPPQYALALDASAHPLNSFGIARTSIGTTDPSTPSAATPVRPCRRRPIGQLLRKTP